MSVGRLGDREDDCLADLRGKKESSFTCGYILSPSDIPSELFHVEIESKPVS